MATKMSTFTQQSKLIKHFCRNHLIKKHIGKKKPLLGTCVYMCSIRTKIIVGVNHAYDKRWSNWNKQTPSIPRLFSPFLEKMVHYYERSGSGVKRKKVQSCLFLLLQKLQLANLKGEAGVLHFQLNVGPLLSHHFCFSFLFSFPAL